jgi:membrane fusion protein, multidrug efflux system
MTVQTANGDAEAAFPGDVHARYEMPLAFRVGGQLVARYVSLGAQVKKGQALAQLDAKDAQDNVASARAALDAAEHRLVFATQQRDRDEEQFKQNLISKVQIEQTRDAHASALAGREQAKQQWTLAQNQTHYTTLFADHDGTVTSQDADVGQVLAPGQQVVGFAWAGERDVHIDVPESRIEALAVGQQAVVRLPALPGRAFSARIREIAAAADTQSRTYRVQLSFDEPDASLGLGMTAKVSLLTSARPGSYTRVPSTALFHDGDRPAVWVVRRDSTLELRPVSVSRYEEQEVLLDSGIRSGERIVMHGVHTVSAGEKVTPILPLHAEGVQR